MDEENDLCRNIISAVSKKYGLCKTLRMLIYGTDAEALCIFPFKKTYVKYAREGDKVRKKHLLRSFISKTTGQIFIFIPDLIDMIFPASRALDFKNLLDKNRRCQRIYHINLQTLWNPTFLGLDKPLDPPEYVYFMCTMGYNELHTRIFKETIRILYPR